MKTLFIGPYRQPDGWGSFSRSIMSSLLSIEEIDLTARPIFLSNSPQTMSQVDPRIFKAESNKQDNYDVLIQHSLPNFMVGSQNFSLNVGITSFETKGNVQNLTINVSNKIPKQLNSIKTKSGIIKSHIVKQ